MILPIPIFLLIMPRSIVSPLGCSTRSSAYFRVRIACVLILKYPNLWRRYLVRYWLYKVNRIGNKQDAFLSPIPVFTILGSFWSVILTLLSAYILLFSFLSRQLMAFTFRIRIISVQCTSKMPSTSQWIKHKIPRLCAKLLWYYSQNPNCMSCSFSSSKSELTFFKHILYFPFNPSSPYTRYYICCRVRWGWLCSGRYIL